MLRREDGMKILLKGLTRATPNQLEVGVETH
jgi:hypothetical protein